ncbi:hypothetical protein MRX96_026473 [Rhipicephalus microplus]
MRRTRKRREEKGLQEALRERGLVGRERRFPHWGRQPARRPRGGGVVVYILQEARLPFLTQCEEARDCVRGAVDADHGLPSGGGTAGLNQGARFPPNPAMNPRRPHAGPPLYRFGIEERN